ncbi:hypothetical protein MATL_G00187400 [Megalops atlanticus]|uniref:Uncharacterized protein n=1 Tax=Megalops atlanticus TaxID=7932 RepID=A0A9D3PKV9_MEGAT|nr:hypothetical protein MATL_G00187400 [Megalops atlanticus]
MFRPGEISELELHGAELEETCTDGALRLVRKYSQLTSQCSERTVICSSCGPTDPSTTTNHEFNKSRQSQRPKDHADWQYW